MRPVTLPRWFHTIPFYLAHEAWQEGEWSDEQWQAYRAVWFYSAPRFSDLVPDMPRVRDINAQLDAKEATCVNATSADAGATMSGSFNAGGLAAGGTQRKARPTTRAGRLERHRARDPHCSCNDCIAYMEAMTDAT